MKQLAHQLYDFKDHAEIYLAQMIS